METDGTTNKNLTTKKRINKIILCFLIVILILLSPILLCNIYLTFKSIFEPNKAPSIFGITPLVIQDEKMQDTFQVGDLVFAKSINYDDIKVKDIIAFYDGNQIKIERVQSFHTDTSQKRLITIGDNSTTQSIVEATEIVGVCNANLVGLGKFIMFMQSTWGMLIFAVLFIIMLWLAMVTNKKADDETIIFTVQNENAETLKTSTAEQTLKSEKETAKNKTSKKDVKIKNVAKVETRPQEKKPKQQKAKKPNKKVKSKEIKITKTN